MILTLAVLAVEVAGFLAVAWWLFRRSFYPHDSRK